MLLTSRFFFHWWNDPYSAVLCAMFWYRIIIGAEGGQKFLRITIIINAIQEFFRSAVALLQKVNLFSQRDFFSSPSVSNLLNSELLRFLAFRRTCCCCCPNTFIQCALLENGDSPDDWHALEVLRPVGAWKPLLIHFFERNWKHNTLSKSEENSKRKNSKQ